MSEHEGPEAGTGTNETTRRPRERLTRSQDDRVIAGVAGGIAHYFGVDPVVVRIGFVAVTLLGGSGILLYLLGWIAIPSEGRRRSVLQQALRYPPRSAVGIFLLVVAGVLLVHELSRWSGARITLPLLLLAFGAALLASRGPSPEDGSDAVLETPGAPDSRADSPDEVPPDGAPPESVGGEGDGPPDEPDGPSSLGGAGSPGGGPPGWRPRSGFRLGRATLGTLLVLAGGAAFLDATGAFDISVEGFLAVALVVTGAALVLSAWWGRARGLILLGVTLVVALGISGAVETPLRGGFGERSIRPANLAELRDEYRLFAGEMTLDLSGVEFDGHVDVEASVVFGQLRVVLPDDVTTQIDARVRAGKTRLLGTTDEGLGVRNRRVIDGSDDTASLRLDLRVGAGEIEVDRAPA